MGRLSQRSYKILPNGPGFEGQDDVAFALCFAHRIGQQYMLALKNSACGPQAVPGGKQDPGITLQGGK